MPDLVIQPVDNTWIRIDCSDDVAHELSDYFTFEKPQAAHIRRQEKYRHWDGKIRLFKLRTHTLYKGLIPHVHQFAEDRSYSVVNHIPPPHSVRQESLDDYLQGFDLPFPPHDFQLAAIRHCLDHERAIVLSPTGSGKSFILYLLTRCLIDSKTLIIVPTIGLLSQLTKAFIEYGCPEETIHVVRPGGSKQSHALLTFTTWQSVYEQEPEYFQQFECVIVDEVHLATAKSLTGIMEQCTNAVYRYGVTGTLNDAQCHQLVLEGLFGPLKAVTTTHALMKDGTLTPLNIKILILEYPDSIKRHNRRENKQYPNEIEFLCSCKPRNEFIVQLVKRLKGNTLVLFQLVEKHGKDLFEVLNAACQPRTHYIDGSTDAETREVIRQYVMANDDQIIVASYGTFSTGIDIPNLDNIVFAHGSKSKIRVLQSLGRSLRVAEGKTTATLYDIVDDLRIGKYTNYSWLHGQERMKYYTSEKFKTSMVSVPLSMFTVKAPQKATNALGTTNVCLPSSHSTDLRALRFKEV